MFLWFKALHIIFVICWFAGIFYLPRLFVHHALREDLATRQRFGIMERRLYRFTTPFAVLTVVFGVAMACMHWGYYKTDIWFHITLILVLVLLAYHFYCRHIVLQFV